MVTQQVIRKYNEVNERLMSIKLAHIELEQSVLAEKNKKLIQLTSISRVRGIVRLP